MNTTTTRPNAATHNAGVPPAPSEARQKAGLKGMKREVVMNGSRLWLEHDGVQWWIVKQAPAPFTR